MAVTEADVRVPIAPAVGGPTPEQVQLHAERHDAMLEACLNVPSCTSFTVWGFPDANSWVPSVFPGLDMRVHAVSQGPVERFVPDGGA